MRLVAGWIGQAGRVTLLVGLVLITLSLLAILVRGLVLTRRIRALERRLSERRQELAAAAAGLAERRAESARLIGPLRRLHRWLRHPLVRALWSSYRVRHRRAVGPDG